VGYIVRALFDSNILIDFLNQREEAKNELRLYKDKFISVITFIEVLSGAKNAEEEIIIKGFLRNFKCIILDEAIALETARLRSGFKLKLGDALIMATSISHNMLLITRDKKDFFNKFNNIKIPYTI
jgi:predicted nucleic acid-binding protein